MNCVDFDEQVALLLDGVASPVIEHALRDHLSKCDSCAARLAQMQDVRTLLRKSVIPGPTDSLDERVMRAFGNRNPSFQAAQPWWRGGVPDFFRAPNRALALSLAAVFVALLAGIAIGRMSVTQQIASPAPTAASTVVATSPQPKNEGTSESPTLPHQHLPLLASETHRPSSRKGVNAARVRTKPLESLTVVSPSGANYTTTANMNGFEPVTGARLRVIKVGEER